MVDLPHRDEDPVMTLYAHYFLAADLNRQNFNKELARRKRLKRPGKDDWKGSVYFGSWLGFLGVTCEGYRKLTPWKRLSSLPDSFQELRPLMSQLNRALKSHEDALRHFRNSVFHLREDLAAVMPFISPDNEKQEWAEGLHHLFRQFFSLYRINCELHYFIKGRHSEMMIERRR